MRRALLILIGAAVVLFSGLTIETRTANVAPVAVFAADPPAAPAAKPDIDVNIGGGEKTEKTFFLVSNPVLALGAAAVIVLIALFALAGRGGGTTIVREK